MASASDIKRLEQALEIALNAHWWTHEPRNEARYEPGPVYEARRPIRGSYGETRRYKARKELFTSLVERRGAAQHVRGSYTMWLDYEARIGT